MKSKVPNVNMNMHEINLNSWEEFEEQLKKLESQRLQDRTASMFLYRGQGDHPKKENDYNLLTTLERNGQNRLSIKEYHHLISKVQPQIESFTGLKWNILSYPHGIDKWLDDNGTGIPHAFGWSPEFQDTYSYMTYLRHYSFPSPLLDWTRSPYVAAYFAFRRVTSCTNNISIYVYLESTSGIRHLSSNTPGIHVFGPYVRTDRRHFLQQSQYTICLIHDNSEWRYVPHEGAFKRCDPNQDVLWKFNIPCSEKLKVLKILDGFNINALSLFGSEESLMETMTIREVHLREKKL